MCGGGGGFFGAILNVVAVFVPPLQPVAAVYNAANAVKAASEGNILGAVASGMGAYGQMNNFVMGDFGAGGFGGAAGGGGGEYSTWDSGTGDFTIDESGALEGAGEVTGNTASFDAGDIVEQSGGMLDAGNVVSDFQAPGELAGIFDNVGEFSVTPPTLEQATAANQFLGDTAQFAGSDISTAPIANIGGGIATNTSIGMDALQDTGSFSLDNMVTNQGGVPDIDTGMITNSGYSGDTGIFTEGSSGFQDGSLADSINVSEATMWDKLKGGASDMLGKSGNIYDKIMKSQQMNPVQMGLRAAGGIDSYLQNKEAESKLNQMYERAMSQSDPFASDRALASSKWQQQVNDPSAGWDEYSAGIMPELQAQNAKLAKAGRRSQLPMQLSLAKQNYMANAKNRLAAYNPNQFTAGTGSQVSQSFAPALATMASNRNAPLFNVGTDILRSMRLSDIYG